MRHPLTPTQIIHAAAGYPDPQRGALVEGAGLCHICAGWLTRGLSVADAVSDSDNDVAFFKASYSRVVCEGCAWTGARKPPDTFRMYTVLYREAGGLPPHADAWSKAVAAGRAPQLALVPATGQVCLTNKGLMQPLVELLCDPQPGPWFAAVADSGNIHTLRMARLNGGGDGAWCVRMERLDVVCEPARFSALAGWCAELLARGHMRGLLERGEPTPSVLMREGELDVWLSAQAEVGDLWDSAAHALAMFVITKETGDGLRERWGRGRSGDRAQPRDGGRVAADDGSGRDVGDDLVRGPREDRRSDGVLASDPQSDSSERAGVEDVGRVARGRPKRAQDRAAPQRAEQLDLFGR